MTLGSFANFSLETQFRLVYVVFNTFFGLLTQDDQVSCFQAVARHLTNDGVFVMQAFVPDRSPLAARRSRTRRVADRRPTASTTVAAGRASSATTAAPAAGRPPAEEGRDDWCIEALCFGDSAEVYRLGFKPGKWWCECPARSRCAHLTALQRVTLRPSSRVVLSPNVMVGAAS
jgi:hypothetical protein